jgi:hypothetical protein
VPLNKALELFSEQLVLLKGSYSRITTVQKMKSPLAYRK